MKPVSVLDLLLTASKATTISLSDDNYNAVVIGTVTSTSTINDPVKGPRQSTSTELVFQLQDDNGAICYLKSKKLNASLNEKSNLTKMMSTWIKKTNPQDIVDALVKNEIIKDDMFSFEGFIGKPCRVAVNMVPSKSDSTKTFANISAVLPAKSESLHEVVVGVYPAWLIKGSDNHSFLLGFELAKIKAELIAENAITGAEDDSSDLPF